MSTAILLSQELLNAWTTRLLFPLFPLFMLRLPSAAMATSWHYSSGNIHPNFSLFPCSDYEMLIVNTRKCVARCPRRCVNRVCYEDGVCPCEGSYATSLGRSLICAADCLPGCKEAGGHCAAPDLCLCYDGFYFNKVAQRCLPSATSLFKDRCRGQCLYGTCSEAGVCTCAQGYEYRPTILGQLCKPICRLDCGVLGYCYLPNMCACRKKHYHYESDGTCRKDALKLGEQEKPGHSFFTFKLPFGLNYG